MDYMQKILEISQKAEKNVADIKKNRPDVFLQMPGRTRKTEPKDLQEILDALEDGRNMDALKCSLQLIIDMTQDLAFKERAAELMNVGRIDEDWASLYRVYTKYRRKIETGEAFAMGSTFFPQVLSELDTILQDGGKEIGGLVNGVYDRLEMNYKEAEKRQ